MKLAHEWIENGPNLAVSEVFHDEVEEYDEIEETKDGCGGVIQVRLSRNPRWQKQGGWEAFEAEGVCPVYCGPNACEQALNYARQRAGYGRAEIQVFDDSGNVTETISNEDLRPLV